LGASKLDFMRAGDGSRAGGARRSCSSLRYGMLVVILACDATVGEGGFRIPEQHEWLDCGRAFAAGGSGEWDDILWGGFALSVVKIDGVYHLYYQGSRAYDVERGTVAWRAVGVATSHDGIRFEKSAANPVLSWFPTHNLEEGATSAATMVDESGRVVMYYGANTWAGRDEVNADARMAISRDGVRFSDTGVVLDHSDPSIWGSGDELFPVVALADRGRRFVYYIPNGSIERGQLGVAWGDTSGFRHAAGVRSLEGAVRAWGPGSVARVGPELYAVFLTQRHARGSRPIEVRTVSIRRPNRMSPPVAVYRWPGVAVASVLLDEEAEQWFLYYRGVPGDRYGVKVARLRRRSENRSAGEVPDEQGSGMDIACPDGAHH
jgi:hypothetical protein